VKRKVNPLHVKFLYQLNRFDMVFRIQRKIIAGHLARRF